MVNIIMNNHFSGQSSNRFSLQLIFSVEIASRKHIDILRLLMLGCLVASGMPDSLQKYGLQPARVLCPWDSPGKNTGVGSHSLLQGIFLTHGSKPYLLCLLHCGQILYPLTPLRSPRLLIYFAKLSSRMVASPFLPDSLTA